MDLLQEILECKDIEIDLIIDKAIKEANANATKVEKLGFLDYGKSNVIFKGFIPLDTRIKYANLAIEDYGMQSTDFIYDFVHLIKQFKINNIVALIYNLEYYINSYFGFPGKIDRETIFNEIAWQNTTTDEEYFLALKNNKIGDLKGKGAAECTERGALAQQILSIFGIETYYCMGCVDLGNKQEPHCFNIVKRQNDYALLDYSIPITSYNRDGSVKAFYPFVGELTNEEFNDFTNNGINKSFNNYCIVENKKEKENNLRKYVIGKYEIEKENKMNNSR